MKVESVRPVGANNVTEAVISAWKKAYPTGVFQLAIDTDEITGTEEIIDEKNRKKTIDKYAQKIGYFKKPTRKELAAAVTGADDPITQGDDLMRMCWLGGDEELLDDEDYFQGTLVQFQEIMKIRAGEIKKL